MENPVLGSQNGVAARIADRSLAARASDYAEEVRRLLDAGRTVMRERGTSARPRVADIVMAAGLSNDAFYRHFASKDDLVVAILEDGAERLHGYLAHQMAKEPTPEAKVRRWVDGILAQARDDEIAATTLAVLWNAGSVASTAPATTLAALVAEPFAELGSADPALDASIAAHALVGRLSDHLRQRTRPEAAETEHLAALFLAAVTPRR